MRTPAQIIVDSMKNGLTPAAAEAHLRAARPLLTDAEIDGATAEAVRILRKEAVRKFAGARELRMLAAACRGDQGDKAGDGMRRIQRIIERGGGLKPGELAIDVLRRMAADGDFEARRLVASYDGAKLGGEAEP